MFTILRNRAESLLSQLRFALLAVFVIMLVSVGGCAYVAKVVDPAREYAGKAAAQAIDAECSLSQEQRLENLKSVNTALINNGSSHRALSLDCNDDGEPDVLQVE